jgi:tetratricopeptide (TPR) repeat protein
MRLPSWPTSFQTNCCRACSHKQQTTYLERNVALEGDLRTERSGATAIQSAVSGAWLAQVFAERGQFEEAIAHAEDAIRIAEAADHPYSLFYGLFGLSFAHLHRRDLPRATKVVERCVDLCRTWEFANHARHPAAALGVVYALTGRTDEALLLVAGALEEFPTRQIHEPTFILLCAGMTYLSVGWLDEANNHAREALALTRRVGARGNEAHALCLNGNIATVAGAEHAEGYYRQALALAEPRGMRPLVAHCHLGLGKMHHRVGNPGQAQEHLTTATAMYREMGMTYWLEQAEAVMRQPC